MSDRENKDLTKEKAQVYEIIFAMFIKFILVVAGIIAFFIVLVHMINEQDNITKIGYAGFNLILGGTIYVVYKHYFPVKK
jgi:hypothetical protein